MANMTFKANLIPQSDLGYELGSNNPTLKRWKIYGDIQPIVKKTYASTGQYATEANSDKANFYFMSVKPETFLKPWTIQFKVRSFCPGYSNGGESITYCTLSGRNNSMIYHNWNERYEAIHYYICSLNLTQAGFNAGLGHAVGISILYGWNYTNSAYYRTFEVELYKTEGCTATLLDAPVLKTNWPSYNTTNYGNHNHYNAVDRGLLETADWDTTGRDYSHSGYLKNGSQFRCPPNTLFGLDRNNNAQAISLYSADYTGGTVSINTARVYNTAGIDWTRGLYYSNSGSNFAASADLNISPAVFFYAVDLRYTDNCVPTSAATTLGMVPRKMVYLRGTIHSDGLFYLAPISVTYNSASYKRVWTQDIPTAVETDGTYQYVYWEIGLPYYNSSYANGGYQINLHDHNKLYWFNNGRFEEYSAGGRGIQNITRSGTTFTVTRDDGTTFTFTQQDNNSVTGVKGNAESSYRTGQVNITPANIGALPLSGGTLTGNLVIAHATNATMTADSTNPKITFSESGTQPVHLIYTDYDNYRSPAGLKVVGGASATPAWFEVEGNIYAAAFKGNADTSTTASNAVYAASAGSVAWGNVTNKPINFKAYAGALNTGGWKTLNGNVTGANLSIAYNNNAATWNSGTYSASLVFGCSDTKGLLDLSYNTPIVTFGGSSNGGSTDDNPKWYFKLSGTSGQTYTFPSTSKTLVATDGTGASGTWDISITGNAATATKLGTTTVGGTGQPIYLNAGVPTAATAYNAATVKYADMLTGFASRAADFSWGNQTGTAVTVMNDSTGGSLGFRRDNPAGGQVSMVIDGTVYIKEGQKNIGDAIVSITRSGTTFTYTTLWGNTGTFTQQDNNSDTKNTAGSTDTSSKIFLIGATSQAANPQTYSDNQVYATNGQLDANKMRVAEHVTLQYNTTTSALDFVFA